ncbi:MAG: phytoene/squalene synthase family protein [Solirubrobacterales bacterium]
MRSRAAIRRPAEPQRDPASVLATSTFSAGIDLLLGDLKADARRLYCLLRTVDDLVDEGDPQAAHRVDAIERWVRGQQADTPETRTLSELARRYPLSPEALIDFCRGMRHDLAGAVIETEDDLRLYCHQVGGTVGIMIAGLFGTSNPDGEAKMDTLGAAMQWTNILRDIDEDLSNGRVYIARSTIERFGVPTPGAREDLLRDQIARADTLYDEGLGAIPLLCNGRRAMGVSAVLYREILRQIERDGYGRTAGRVVVPTWRKHLLIAEHSLGRRWSPAAPPGAPS